MKVKMKKGELILLGCGVIIITLFLTNKAIQKTYFKFARLEKEAVLNEEKLLQLDSILKHAEEINSQYEGLVAGYQEITDSDNLLREIEEIANKTNLTILDMKPGAVKDGGLFKTYLIKISAQDEILPVARFLYGLAEKLKIVGVERVQIKNEIKNELPKVTLLINAAVFKE
jgi:Tfp pilus assembly protein PilO